MIEKLYTTIFDYCCDRTNDPDIANIYIDGIKSIYNIPYGKNKTNNVFDMHIPADGKKHPTILLIHGGGYVAGQKEDLNLYAAELLKSNYCVINMEYSKCRPNNNVRMPKQIQEVFDLFKCLKNHPKLNEAIDYNNFFIGGDSAGAHIAALVASIQTNDGLKYDFNLCGGPKIKGGIYVCPVFGAFKFYGLFPKRQLHNLVYGKDNDLAEICHNLDILSPYFPPSIVFTTANDIISKKHVSIFGNLATENNLSSKIIMTTQGHKLAHNSIIRYANKYPACMNEIKSFIENCTNGSIKPFVEYAEIEDNFANYEQTSKENQTV